VLSQLLFSSGPKLLKDSDPDRGGCWALVRKARDSSAVPSSLDQAYTLCQPFCCRILVPRCC